MTHSTDRFSPCLLAPLALLAVLLLGAAGAQTAEAQTQWRQRFQVIAPVQDNTVASALRDSIVDLALRENLSLRRAPEDERPRPIRQIEDDLLSTGVDFLSANRMLLRYDFQATSGRLRRDIKELYFIYRPEGVEGNDMPILTIDFDEQPAIANLVATSGMRLRTNEAAIDPFREKLMYHNLPESQLVSLGGRVIRDPDEAEAERQRIIGVVERYLQ